MNSASILLICNALQNSTIERAARSLKIPMQSILDLINNGQIEIEFFDENTQQKGKQNG